MNEIKVFLVEDEMVIRRGIKNSIDWEKEGYIFCGEASDGELAYPMIIKEKPDILITDIRMPFMDGLELCKLVKKELPNIKILILSGYDEFDYAKEAIRLGVTEYLLKPISSGKLLEALNGVSESIRREKEDKDLVRKYMEEMRENTEHEKQKFFEQMIAGNLSMADALETGEKYEMNLSARMYNLLLFRFTLGEENRKSGELLGEAEYAIEKLTERLEYVFEFQRGVEGWAFLLMADNEEQMSERVKELSKDLEEIMKNYSTIAYFGGIGQPVARLRELEESFREAERALAARFTMELNQIISVEDIRMAQNVDTLDDIEITSFGEIEKTRTMLEKFLNNGAEDEIDEFVDVYINELSEENLKSVLMRQYIIMDAYIVMMSFCEKFEGIEGEMQAQSEELKNSINSKTILVSIMFANNEVGTIEPIKETSRIVHSNNAIFHTDAVQAVGHVDIDVKKQKIDMLSLSAHKFHGPKGIGVLYVRKGVPLFNLIEGGAQERGRRAGTENIPAIVGMAAALKEAVANMDENMVKIAAMRDRLIEGLSTIEHSRLNGDAKKRLPGNVNFCFEGIEGESLLLLLDEKGIEASSGSACTSGSLDPSHVLLAIGLPHEVAHGSLRLTLCEENTPEQIEYIIKEVPEIVSYLRNISPVWEELEKGEKKHVI